MYFLQNARRCETYFIGSRKLGYDIEMLLHNADNKIHESIRAFVPPPALAEVRAAGRCLALESYTASGFHVLRALELAMTDYYQNVSGKSEEFKSWNDCIKALGALVDAQHAVGGKYPSAKVVAMLERVKTLDRNPLMHPRDSLDEAGADTLFLLAVATITEMVKDLREMNSQPQLRLLQNNADSEGQAEAS